MQKRIYFLLATANLLIFFSANSQANIDYGNNAKAGGYFNNNGVKVYYEVYGQGKPMIILHGNGGSIAGRASFIEEFSKKYKVIAMDNRCHGKTGCPVGYPTYEQMAEDMNALLNYLHIDSALVWGHSDGGIVGLLLAIHHPDKVKKLLASGSNLRPDTTAIDPGILPVLEIMRKEAQVDSVHIKQFSLLVDEPHIPLSDLKKIKSDVLIMAGDRDVIRNEHTLEIFKNIPGALLCILPGTTHMVFQDRRAWFTSILYDFFDNPPRRTTTVEMLKSIYKN